MEALKVSYSSSDIEPFYVSSSAATVSSDGGILATPVEEDVIITDLTSNEIIHRIEGDGELVTNLIITPDASKLAILSQSQQLRIFDLNEARIVKNHKMSSPVYVSTVDINSSLFAFGGSDGIITVWDIADGYVTHSLKGHGTTVCSLKFHGELHSVNWRLASADIMGAVKVWDLVKRKCIKTISEHNSAVRGLDFSYDGSRLLSAGRDNVVIIYDTKNYKPLHTYPIKEQVEAGGFLEIDGGDYVYTAGSDNLLRIWDINTKSCVSTSPEPLKTNEELMIIDVIKLFGNKLLLVISDQTLTEIDLSSLVENVHVSTLPILRRIAGNHGTVADVKYVGPELNLLALATNSPSLRIVDPLKPMELKLYEAHKDLLNALDVSSDGRWIATGSKDNEAKLWVWDDDVSDFVLFASFQGHIGSVTALSLSKSEQKPLFLITGSSDLTVKKWRIPSVRGSVVKVSEYTRRAHEKDINSIDVSPNDEFFATASYDKLGKIWNSNNGEVVGVLRGHRRGLWDINFCHYDKLVVTSSGDKTAKVWSLTEFTCKHTFEGHTNSVQRAKFFNTNSQVVTSGADGLVKLWDIKSEEVVKTFDKHANRIWSLVVKDDGREFVSADADGNICIWTDNSEEVYQQQEEERKLRVEQDQELSNLINSNDWSNAFLLALTLNHPMRLYNIVREAVNLNEDKESVLGSLKLENTISQLDDEQLILLFKKLRDWNINFKFYELSQKVINVILKSFPAEQLMQVKSLMKIIESILPYNERHYSRIDDLVEESYILDYAVDEMDKLGS